MAEATFSIVPQTIEVRRAIEVGRAIEGSPVLRWCERFRGAASRVPATTP
jgi:hypothetical protein